LTDSRVAAPGARPRVVFRAGWRPAVSSVAVLVLAVAISAASLSVLSGAWQVWPIVSGSMRPTLQPGGLAVVEREPIAGLRAGDVIVFRAPNGTGQLVVHRVTAVVQVSGGALVSTRGDANGAADLWSPFHLSGPYVYRERFSLPLIGYPGILIHTRLAQLLFLMLGGLLGLSALIILALPDRTARTFASFRINPFRSKYQPIER